MTKVLLRIIASLLLLFNGIGTLYGGGNLILHPDGSSLQLSLDWLQHTSFQNYLIPGIILFVANGLFSIIVCIAVFLRYRNSALLVMMQGVILMGWILIQVKLRQTIYFLHVILGSVGLALLVIGYLLKVGTNRDQVKPLEVDGGIKLSDL